MIPLRAREQGIGADVGVWRLERRQLPRDAKGWGWFISQDSRTPVAQVNSIVASLVHQHFLRRLLQS